MPTVLSVGECRISNGNRKPRFFSWRAAALHDKIRGLKLPLLILHSPTDNTVGIENASEIFRTARHPRSFVSLEGSDHLLTGTGQAHRAARIIGAWADAYLVEDQAGPRK